MEDSYKINIRKYDTYVPTLQETEYIGKLTNIKPNDISYLFFSDHNINTINYILIERIKDTTYKKYGKKLEIQPQKKEILVTIMRHIYLKNIKNQYPAEDEVDNMNSILLDEMFPVVLDGLISQIRYVNNRNKFNLLDQPISDNKRRDNLPAMSSLFGF